MSFIPRTLPPPPMRRLPPRSWRQRLAMGAIALVACVVVWIGMATSHRATLPWTLLVPVTIVPTPAGAPALPTRASGRDAGVQARAAGRQASAAVPHR